MQGEWEVRRIAYWKMQQLKNEMMMRRDTLTSSSHQGQRKGNWFCPRIAYTERVQTDRKDLEGVWMSTNGLSKTGKLTDRVSICAGVIQIDVYQHGKMLHFDCWEGMQGKSCGSVACESVLDQWQRFWAENHFLLLYMRECPSKAIWLDGLLYSHTDWLLLRIVV